MTDTVLLYPPNLYDIWHATADQLRYDPAWFDRGRMIEEDPEHGHRRYRLISHTVCSYTNKDTNETGYYWNKEGSNKDKNRITPLHRLCMSKDLTPHLIRWFSTNKKKIPSSLYVFVNAQTLGGKATPLYYAIISQNFELVEDLLKHGADPNLGDGGGTMPFWAAFDIDRDRVGLPNAPILCDILLKYGAKPIPRMMEMYFLWYVDMGLDGCVVFDKIMRESRSSRYLRNHGDEEIIDLYGRHGEKANPVVLSLIKCAGVQIPRTDECVLRSILAIPEIRSERQDIAAILCQGLEDSSSAISIIGVDVIKNVMQYIP